MGSQTTFDQMADNVAINALEQQYPGWMVFRQGKGVWLRSCFARCRANGDQVEGEDWDDLRDEINRYIGRRDA